MSYDNVTPHEIRISQNLQKVSKKLNKLLKTLTGDECHFILIVSSMAQAQNHGTKKLKDAPISSYVANSDRHTSAMCIAELLMKWEMNGQIPPIHELRDSTGRSLGDILNDSKIN